MCVPPNAALPVILPAALRPAQIVITSAWPSYTGLLGMSFTNCSSQCLVCMSCQSQDL